MEKQANNSTTHRRGFLGMLATGAAATIALPAMAAPFRTPFTQNTDADDPDAWFNSISGKHRIVFDATEPHEIFPFAWPKVFLMTNQATGSSPKDCGVVVILRHNAIPYAFESRIWSKYKFGDYFKVNDFMTKNPSQGNNYWKNTTPINLPGVGPVILSIDDLQASGVKYCICGVAMAVNEAIVAQQMKMDPAEVKKDWESGLLPGIQVVPSGVWAVGRAQEHGCAYCFVG